MQYIYMQCPERPEEEAEPQMVVSHHIGGFWELHWSLLQEQQP